MDGLVLAADEIIIEIDIQIIHAVHIREGVEDINVVHVEGVLRQLQAALPEHLRPEDDRVHQDVFTDREAVGLVPGKDPAHRQTLAVLHDRVTVLVLLVVDEIADEKIQRGFRSL